MNFFSDLIFTPEVFILRKKIWGPRVVNVDVPVSICLPGFVQLFKTLATQIEIKNRSVERLLVANKNLYYV